jgi:hypothetical protein
MDSGHPGEVQEEGRRGEGGGESSMNACFITYQIKALCTLSFAWQEADSPIMQRLKVTVEVCLGAFLSGWWEVAVLVIESQPNLWRFSSSRRPSVACLQPS